jgi:putative ABC transport system permease protein
MVGQQEAYRRCIEGVMDALWSDLRYSIRAWRRTPVFAAVAFATLACGTGAAIGLFSLVNVVLLRPLPYPDAERVVVLVNSFQGQAIGAPFVSSPRIRVWREHSSAIREIAVYSLTPVVNLNAGDDSHRVAAGQVTAGFFSFYGARVAHGRPFTEEEDRNGAALTVVLSHGFWQSRFGGEHAVVGSVISVNGEPAVVIGVLDDRFDTRSLYPVAAATPEIWLPLRLDPNARDDANNLFAVGRLSGTVGIEVARAQPTAAADAFRVAFPGELPPEASFTVMPLATLIVGDARPSLLMLLGAVAAVTLLVGANTANLLLGRASARRREFALRIAVGASPARLLRQLMVEGITLSLAGALAGCVLGLSALRLFARLQGVHVPRFETVGVAEMLDLRVALFVVALSAVLGTFFALAPMARVRRVEADVESELKPGVRAGGDRASKRMHVVLLTCEVALACVLVIGAVLLARSLAALQRVDPGFEPRGVLTLQTALGERRFGSTTSAVRMIETGLTGLAQLPGVESAAVTFTGVPLEQGGALGVHVVGRQMDRQYVQAWDAISPAYFNVFRITLIRGRTFTERDRAGSPPVAIINESMAGQLWPDADAIGARILIGQGGGPAFEEATPREIVGVVSDVRQFGLNRPPRPGMYVPLAQTADAQMAYLSRRGVSATWVVRARVAPAALSETAQRTLFETTGVPAGRVRTMDDVFELATAPMARNMWLMVVFAGLAMLLAVIGVYAISAHSVHQRTHELGVRLALGARASQLRRMVLWDSLRVALAGTAIGVVAAMALANFFSALVYGVTPQDPWTYAVVPAVMILATVCGAAIPASHAARVDPLVTLKSE